jgi:C-terminal processing protease CtpA/Prc
MHFRQLRERLIICLTISIPLNVQSQMLPRNEVELAINQMTIHLSEKYVFPKKGIQIAAHLKKSFLQGQFNQVKSWKQLDSLVTLNLQEFSRDGHLYVRHDPKTAQELASPPSKDKEKCSTDASADSFFYGTSAAERNFGFQEVKVLEGNLGYLKISEINISEKSLPVLIGAMRFVANTQALIIDLRNNGGGGSAIGNVFESYFLPKETPLLQFMTRDGRTETGKTVAWLLEKKYDKPLFILVNGGTGSAAEAFTYVLKRHGRAKVVGQRSGGKAHMNSWYPVNSHLFISVSTGAPTWPGTEESWEQTGIEPDVLVPEGHDVIGHITKQIKERK